MENINLDNNTVVEQLEIAKNILQERLQMLITNSELQKQITEKIAHISVNLLDRGQFLKLSGADPKSLNIPGAFYYNGNVYLNNIENFNKKEFHKLIHEMLHSISDNFKISGKTGLTQYYYDDNNKLDATGHVINEAATEYLTAVILNDTFFGYSNDLNYIMQTIMCIMDMDNAELANLYFQNDMWLNGKNNRRFNSENVGLLTEIVSEYDNRLPRYKKKDYDFDFVFSSILDTVNLKITSNENIDFVKLKTLLSKIRDYHDWIDIQDNTIQKYNDIMTKLNQIVSNLDYAQVNLLEYQDNCDISATIRR